MSDLQEDKETLFDALDTAAVSLEAAPAILAGLHFRPERMRAALEAGFLTATDLADYLVSKGVPFRSAHHHAGQAVQAAEKRGVELSALTLEELRAIAPEVGADRRRRLRGAARRDRGASSRAQGRAVARSRARAARRGARRAGPARAVARRRFGAAADRRRASRGKADGGRPTRMSRRVREQAILELIESEPVSNQDEIVERLRARGIQATQATVSRDIKRLGLVKTPAASAAAIATRRRRCAPRSMQRGRRQLKIACEQFLTKVEPGGSLLVLKTLSGRANALAVALDEARLDEIVGTIAGDDTILVIARDARDRDKVKKLFDEMVG